MASTAFPTHASRKSRLLKEEFDAIRLSYEQRSQNGLLFWVNGKRIELPNGTIGAEETILDLLRLRLRFTSCKLGCGEGGCGACTVMVSSFDANEGRFFHRSVNACLTPVLSLHGTAITTSEGICSATSLHPIQKFLSDTHGSQCGFCTPGIVMSMYSKWMEISRAGSQAMEEGVTLLDRLTNEDIEDALDGNLCRCTGYRPIIEGFSLLTKTKPNVVGEEEFPLRRPSASTSVSSSCDLNDKQQTSITSHSLTTASVSPVDGVVLDDYRCNYGKTPPSISTRASSFEESMARRKKVEIAYELNKSDMLDNETSSEIIIVQTNHLEHDEPVSLRNIQSDVIATASFSKSVEWLQIHEQNQRVLLEHLAMVDTARLPLYYKTKHLGLVTTWITPISLKDLLILTERLNDSGRRYRLVHGNSERHVERIFKRTHAYPLTLISTTKIHELCSLQWNEQNVVIGASYPVNRIRDEFKKKFMDPNSSSSQNRILDAYIHQIRWFAGCQIRNVAGLGGNISTASPISDLNPIHLAAGAVLHIARLEFDPISESFEIIIRKKPIRENFFLGYRKVDLQSREILVSICIPLPHHSNFHLFGFKQSRRREDDIAIVNGGMSIQFCGEKQQNHSQQQLVEECIVAYGGMAPMTVQMRHLSAYWKNKKFDVRTFLESLPILIEETAMSFDTPGGQVAYRMQLARNFYCKFFFQIATERALNCHDLFDGESKDRLLSIMSSIQQSQLENSPLSIIDLMIKKYFFSQIDDTRLQYIPFHPTYHYCKEHSKGLQHVGNKSGNLLKRAAAGEANKHLAGDLHVTGKAIYLDDVPNEANELHAFLVTSPEAHAKILAIDLTECQAVIGFVDFFDHRSIVGINKIGAIFQDEEVFASEEVHSVGQPIGIVIGTSHEAARDAGSRIKFTFQKLETCLSIEDAIEKKRFFKVDFDGAEQLCIHVTQKPTSGVQNEIPKFSHIDQLWNYLGATKISRNQFCEDYETTEHQLPHSNHPSLADDHQNIIIDFPLIRKPKDSIKPMSYVSKCGHYMIVTGSICMGGQEHFYLETQCARVSPSENDELIVLSSTQDPTKTQSLVSTVTGIPKHKIVCKCRRMGGGFGGKETRSCFFAAYTAVAAQVANQPVRLVLDRDTDFQCSGQRHSFLNFYKVAIEISTKKIIAVDLQLFNNAGWSTDLSVPVMERALFHCENSYYIPNLRVVGRCCRTNLPSNTAFRGFGGPQGMFLAETYIEHCAAALGCDADEVREANLYKIGNITHYKYPIIESHLERMWKEIKERADYANRKQKVKEFNETHLLSKRGIRIVPVKFGMSFTKAFMNQAGSLVHVYTDGTVLVSHTGTEMGQGLHTKVAQAAATTFDIPLDSVCISETSTDKVPNGMPTAASSGSDLNGVATIRACQQILERLQPFLAEEYARQKINDRSDKNLELTDEVRAQVFKKASFNAHMNKINLSANGFYATPEILYDFKTNTGRPFHYFAYGIGCSEVEIDVLTGDHKILRTDIIQDVGRSLNPAIDIGQIEGAFVQGMGLFTLEQLITMPNGVMFTRGPAGYKIPAFGDIPTDFRVTLLEDVENPAAPSVYSSKGVGEPPLFLASSVFFAIKDAIESIRLDLIQGVNQQSYHKLIKDDEFLSLNKNRLFFQLDSPATSERICNASHRL